MNMNSIWFGYMPYQHCRNNTEINCELEKKGNMTHCTYFLNSFTVPHLREVV